MINSGVRAGQPAWGRDITKGKTWGQFETTEKALLSFYSLIHFIFPIQTLFTIQKFAFTKQGTYCFMMSGRGIELGNSS